MNCLKCGARTAKREKVCADKKACADRVLDRAARHLAAVESAKRAAMSPGIRREGETSKNAEARLYREAMGL